jgi:ATP-dependent protease ClpP protease subunit
MSIALNLTKWTLGAVVGTVILAKQQDTKSYFIGELDNNMEVSVLKDIDAAETFIFPNETLTIIIKSPGGLADSYKNIKRAVTSSKIPHINTKITGWAASAAALTFLLGEERTMTEDSTILFHYVRVTVLGQAITAEDLRLFKAKDPNLNPDKYMAIKVVEASGQLDEIFKYLEKIDSELDVAVDKIIGTDNRKKILVHGKDITLTSKEALSLNVATKVE